MADISETYINYDNTLKTFTRKSHSGTGTIVVPRNDQRTGLTIEAAAANTGNITYQFTGGPNTNGVFDLMPGGAVEFNIKKGNLPILACTVTCGGQSVIIEEW